MTSCSIIILHRLANGCIKQRFNGACVFLCFFALFHSLLPSFLPSFPFYVNYHWCTDMCCYVLYVSQAQSSSVSLYSWAGTAQSVQRLATGWTVWGSNTSRSQRPSALAGIAGSNLTGGMDVCGVLSCK